MKTLFLFLCLTLLAAPPEIHENKSRITNKDKSQSLIPLFPSLKMEKWPLPLKKIQEKLTELFDTKVISKNLKDYSENVNEAISKACDKIEEVLTKDGFDVTRIKKEDLGNIFVIKKNKKEYKLHLKVKGSQLWLFLEMGY